MNKCKIIFSDIDGTLLNSEHKITENTKKKIKEFEVSGIPFILVSARMPAGIYPLQKDLDIKSPIVCYSGGLVIDKNGNEIESRGIECSKAIEVKSYIDGAFNEICASLYSYNQWIVDDIENEWIFQEVKITNAKPICGNIKSILNNKEVHKILCMGNPEAISELGGKLKKKYPELSVYKSKDTYLEIMDGSASKSNAIKVLCKSMNIEIEDSISFGDNYNDIDMLKVTGKGYAMGNALDDVKREADYITLDNDKDGIAEVLKNYCFND